MRADLDGLLEPGDFFVEALAFAVEFVVVALQLRVLLLQIIESPDRVTQTLVSSHKNKSNQIPKKLLSIIIIIYL